MNSEKITDVVGVVCAVREAQIRVPKDLGDYTFYGAYDEWMFLSSNHQHMCDTCADYDGDVFFGVDLRTAFPYHTILDKDTISPSVHLNCYCILKRLMHLGGG